MKWESMKWESFYHIQRVLNYSTKIPGREQCNGFLGEIKTTKWKQEERYLSPSAEQFLVSWKWDCDKRSRRQNILKTKDPCLFSGTIT
jgi:hypothetical protein